MPSAPKQFRPAGYKQRDGSRTPEQMEYRKWYRRLPWTDGKSKGLRFDQLRRQPCCEECERNGHTTPATDVDHRIPHRGDWDKFIDESNIRSLCAACHGRKTASGG